MSEIWQDILFFSNMTPALWFTYVYFISYSEFKIEAEMRITI